MKIENLKVGMVIKNYKELCKLLEIEEKGGSSKKCQMNKLSVCCKFHKEGQKIIIDEIYDTPLPTYDGRGKNPNSHGNNHIGRGYKHQPQFKIPKEHFDSKGVYCIIVNHDIYIGSTNNTFRQRFNQHKAKDNSLITKEILENETTQFIMLKEMNSSTEFEIRLKEEEYIQHYINNTDWNVVNEVLSVKIKGRINQPPKYKSIKVLESDYEKALQILQENNINIKQI